MEITIFGPNLGNGKQRLGDLHVHAAGCGDCRKYRGEESETAVADTRREVVEFIYIDHMGDEDSPWTDYEGVFYWAPCVRSLPTLEHTRYGYDCPVTFINDRDDPLTAESISTWFEEITGRQPTADELLSMNPDSDESIREQAAWYRGGSV